MNYFQLICNKRFISNCRNPKANRQSTILSTRFRPGSNLPCEDSTTNFSCTRNEEFNEQQEVAASSSLNILHPFIDNEGLLRVGERLQQSTLPYQTMHHIILPSNHHFTKLVASAEHIRLHF